MKRILVISGLVTAFVLLAGIGPNPRYIEELRVGGGYGDAVDGGADFEKDGDIFTNGAIVAASYNGVNLSAIPQNVIDDSDESQDFPGTDHAANQADSLEEELDALRHMVRDISGQVNWYDSVPNSLNADIYLRNTGDVIDEGDLSWHGPTDLLNIGGVKDVQVYVTAQDSDGGRWRIESARRRASWYTETLGDADRGNRAEFPETAILAVTDSYLYIYDAADNSLWMRFDASASRALLAGDASNGYPATVFGLNGRIFVGADGGTYGRLFCMDFVADEIWYANIWGTNIWSKGIAGRNDTTGNYSSWVMLGIVGWNVHDVRACQIAGKNFVSAATDDGVTVFHLEDKAAYDYDADVSGTGDTYIRAWVTFSGDLWAANSSAGQLELWIGDGTDKGDENPGTPDQLWDEDTPASGPVFPDSSVAINDIYVVEGNSLADGLSTTVYVGTDDGLTVFDTKAGDEPSGGVSYMTKSYVSEVMLGDVRLMCPLVDNAASTSVSDVSWHGNTLTASTNTSNLTASGVRGKGFHLTAASSQYLSRAYDTDFNFGAGSFSVCFWFRHATISTEEDFILDRTDASTVGWQVYMDNDGDVTFRITDDGTTWDTAATTSGIHDNNTWHHAACVKDGTTGIYLYIDGELAASDTSLSETGSLSGSSPTLDVGRDNGGIKYWDGDLDELFITATALKEVQVRRMYLRGKRALQSHGTDDLRNQLSGTTNIVKGVSADAERGRLLVATNSGTQLGAVSELGMGSDTREDHWYNGIGKVDDNNVAWNSDNLRAVSVAGHTVAMGTDAELWVESEDEKMGQARWRLEGKTSKTIRGEVAKLVVPVGRYTWITAGGATFGESMQYGSGGSFPGTQEVSLQASSGTSSLERMVSMPLDLTRFVEFGIWVKASSTSAVSMTSKVYNMGTGGLVKSVDVTPGSAATWQRKAVRVYPWELELRPGQTVGLKLESLFSGSATAEFGHVELVYGR